MTLLGQLDAVIVNHRAWEATSNQLSAYQRDDPEAFAQIEWWVIDNGEREDSDGKAKVLRLSPTINILHTENRGYGAAINQLRHRTARTFLLGLNADLLPRPGFLLGLAEILARMQASQEGFRSTITKREGIVGFHLLNPDGSTQGSAGCFPTLVRLLAGLLRPRAKRKYLELPLDQPIDVPWVTGACFVASRACLDAVDWFDERYFMYYEDVDLCRRASRAGWRIRFDPVIAATHFHPYHARSLTLGMVWMARHSLLLYFHKHRPRWEYAALTRICLLESWVRGSNPGWREIGRLIRQVANHPEPDFVPFDWGQLRDDGVE